MASFSSHQELLAMKSKASLSLMKASSFCHAQRVFPVFARKSVSMTQRKSEPVVQEKAKNLQRAMVVSLVHVLFFS